MKTPEMHFYFDYLSPYAYFAWRQIQPLCQRYTVNLRAHPVVFGKLLDHWGQLGPAEIAPKKVALYKYCYRYAELHGFKFNPPRFHPYNPLPSLRLSLPEVSGAHQSQMIDSLFSAGWSEGADLASTMELAPILNSAGFDATALLAAIETQEVKDALHRETELAIGQGVFGVPTFLIDGELFWGNDQIEHIELFLQGNDPIKTEHLEEMLARPRGIDRVKTTDSPTPLTS